MKTKKTIIVTVMLVFAMALGNSCKKNDVIEGNNSASKLKKKTNSVETVFISNAGPVYVDPQTSYDRVKVYYSGLSGRSITCSIICTYGTRYGQQQWRLGPPEVYLTPTSNEFYFDLSEVILGTTAPKTQTGAYTDTFHFKIWHIEDTNTHEDLTNQVDLTPAEGIDASASYVVFAPWDGGPCKTCPVDGGGSH